MSVMNTNKVIEFAMKNVVNEALEEAAKIAQELAMKGAAPKIIADRIRELKQE